MDTFFHAILLGIIEGLTEFIPVSSTGHLILFVDLIGFAGPPGKTFEVAIQLGAILAVCWLYRQKLIEVTISLPTEKAAQKFTRNVLLAFLPAALIGVMTHGFIKEVLFSPTVVSISLITGGIAILIIERLSLTAKHESIKQFSWPLALKIGFCQTLAMIPGVSRSGASIMGAMLLGVERKTATEFSFFLAIPTMFGAVVYDLYKNLEYLDAKDAEIIAVGFVMAFLAGLVVVKHLIAFISKHGFTPFGYYRIAIGSIMLILLSGS